jgi:hypothetical protein
MQTILLYIDPGSGSYIVQAIVAAALGAAFFMKSAWLRIKMFFKKKKDEDRYES